MAFDVAKFSNRKLPAVVKFGGESVKIEYRGGKEAREFEEKAQEVEREQIRLNRLAARLDEMGPDERADFEAQQDTLYDSGRKRICEILPVILVGWDVQMDGEAVKIDAKTLDSLPMPTQFYNAIMNKILEELQNGGRGAGKA